MINTEVRIERPIVPPSQNGVVLNHLDIGKRATITVRENQGEDEGTVRCYSGRIDTFGYLPARVHRHEIPSELTSTNMPEAFRDALNNALKAAGGDLESGTVMHGEPERILFGFEGCNPIIVNVNESTWLIDIE